jgi:hypothetical protein
MAQLRPPGTKTENTTKHNSGHTSAAGLTRALIVLLLLCSSSSSS